MASKTDSKHHRCRCCFQEKSYSRDLWAKYVYDGKTEVYGEMLSECFGTPLVESTEYREQICEACILQLREAINLRHKFVATGALLDQTTRENTKPKSRKRKRKCKEPSKITDETKESETENRQFDIIKIEVMEEDTGEMEDQQNNEEEEDEYSNMQDNQDEEMNGEENVDTRNDSEYLPEQSEDSSPDEDLDSARGKKFQDKMQQALNAVRSKEMIIKEAAEHFGINRETLRRRLKKINNMKDIRLIAEKRELSKTRPKAVPNKDMPKHRDNVRALLLNTNSTPIKGCWGIGYGCYFCIKQYQIPRELKQHTITTHNEEFNQFQGVKHATEFALKLDISDLKCYLCEDDIRNFSLDQLYDHLIAHNLPIHRDIPNQIVPYRFGSEGLTCIDCKEPFFKFKLLEFHMPDHYGNFNCKLCDRRFINNHGLDRHEKRHELGVFVCQYCEKQFSTKTSKSRHERIIHRLGGKAMKCCHCDETFSSTEAKQKHEVEKHNASPVTHGCNICKKSFSARWGMLEHIRKVHQNTVKSKSTLKCPVCDKRFSVQRDLTYHVTNTHLNKSQKSESQEGGEISQLTESESHLIESSN